jgi:hypothetical protein
MIRALSASAMGLRAGGPSDFVLRLVSPLSGVC